ncbi:MAG: tRNA lysidine(34) synthetase TilS [Proteobacteria bacterium]|nr:tRNA lysidine(34) synthetase TilS [Pseudomonadota bacterium]
MTLAVAVSGGRDSTALLHAAVRAGQTQEVTVVALHVHHGLHPQADAWRQRVQAQCRRWGAGFAWRRLSGAPAAGESVEAWARAGRYAALAEMAREAGATEIWLAHHRRDLAETVMLQLLRGGGPAGLSAMPRVTERDGLRWVRPWLHQPAEAVAAYARQHRLSWVDDPSNADPRHARNRLRLAVWPVLTAAFPDAEGVLAQSAQHAAHAAALAREVAATDLATTADAGGLRLAGWLALPPARRANALHAWLGAQATAALTARLLDELPTARSGATWPLDAGTVLALYRGVLAPQPLTSPGTGPVVTLALTACGSHAVPGWAGALRVDRTAQGGVAPDRLAPIVLRARSGGERFACAAGAPPRSLKKQYQTQAVPAWARSGPLVFGADGALLYAPGLGMDARAWAPPGTVQWALRWVPAQAAP